MQLTFFNLFTVNLNLENYFCFDVRSYNLPLSYSGYEYIVWNMLILYTHFAIPLLALTDIHKCRQLSMFTCESMYVPNLRIKLRSNGEIMLQDLHRRAARRRSDHAVY